MTFPANPPAGLFWSLTTYDADTASGVDASGQTYPSLNSMNNLVKNQDGSFTIFVGPEKPEGNVNWIKSVPNRGWFALFRFYGPKKEYFERQYKPGDFEKVK